VEIGLCLHLRIYPRTMCTRMLILNRSRTPALSYAAGRMSVENHWEKGNAHGLEFDVMV
jgi:hypothetical protein